MDREVDAEPEIIEAATKQRLEEQRALLEKDELDYFQNKTRTGGSYVPPGRLALLKKTPTDPNSAEYQRVTWESLKKNLTGLLNRANTSVIKEIIPGLFKENLIRSRGIFSRLIMRQQASAQAFTDVYAAIIAVINTKLPMIGEICLSRIVHQFKKSFKRNDKQSCIALTTFLAHLVNQKVAHEILALMVLTLLLERPTDDSVEIAVGFMRECGGMLTLTSPKPTNLIFERFRAILHEGKVNKRVQYMIEVLFQIRKDQFKDYPSVRDELDLIDEEDVITHYITLDDDDTEDKIQEQTNVFKHDPRYVENEQKYNDIVKEILGDDVESQVSEDESDEPAKEEDVIDNSGIDLTSLRKDIYLTVQSSMSFEECGHKLLKLPIPESQKSVLVTMIVECCSQERIYNSFFGLLGERFCKISPIWQAHFEKCFLDIYNAAHKLDTNRLRNVSKFFAHLLVTDSIPWTAFECVKMTETDTTAATRILIKFILSDLLELMGISKLKERLVLSNELKPYLEGMFPSDNPRNLRFAINFYTAIQLGGLTEGMREKLKELMTVSAQMERPTPVPLPSVQQNSELRDRDQYRNDRTDQRNRERSPKRIEHNYDHDRSRKYDNREDYGRR